MRPPDGQWHSGGNETPPQSRKGSEIQGELPRVSIRPVIFLTFSPHDILDNRLIEVPYKGAVITVPTEEEMLRIKAVLILKRNATRDYLDFVALGDRIGDERVGRGLESFDRLYPQPSGESALQQLQAQLGNPMPYDLKEVNLSEYKNLDPKWHDWDVVVAAAAHLSGVIFDRAAQEVDEQDLGR